jgi:hypothetical protein
MSRLHEFERMIDGKLRALFRGPEGQGQKRELVEVHRAILDEVAGRIETLPRGRRAFAYPHLAVSILLPDPSRRRSYEVAFVEAGALAADIQSRLEDEGIPLPEHFRVDVFLVEELPPDIASRGFDVSYESSEPPRPAPAGIPSVWLKVVHGRAERDEYTFQKSRINLGRLADVVDAHQRFIRRNDVAFVESSAAPNASVSRTHAHLEFDAGSQHFRIYDDRSAQGTTVLRDGLPISVPRGLSKGVQLRNGDEIVLGQARIAFEVAVGSETA